METNIQEKPLISVCIISYKSSSTIIDTLESIKNQDYENKELIVSDDGSTDKTCSIVDDWLIKNKTFFKRVKLVTVEKNTGVALNLDRGIQECKGKWIKILAGDDQLNYNCLSTFEKYSENEKEQFFLCDLELFSEDGEVPERTEKFYRFFFKEVRRNKKYKKNHVLTYFDYPGPAWFFSKKLYDEVGGMDKNYSMMDEWPFIYKVLKADYDIIPVPEKLVRYRVSLNSLSHGRNPLGNEVIFRQNKQFFYNVRIHDLRKKFMFLHILDQKLYYKTMENQFAYYEKHKRRFPLLSIPYRLSVVYIIRKIKLLFC